MHPGRKVVGPSTVVDKAEMVAFATIWDPFPFHIDEEAGKAAFGGLTAPGIYVLALKQRLIHQLREQLHEQSAVLASLGYDEVRFHAPVRPGDTLTLVREWLTRRVSQSKGDRGIVTVRVSLVNQSETTVMSYVDILLVRRREGAGHAGT
jgi:acyl dehydratase